MNTPELREKCASNLIAGADRLQSMTAFVGLDGFVDEILHVVDKRENAETYQRLPTIAKMSARLAGAAGVTYLGTLGYPALHPVFSAFAQRAEVHSIAEPGYTDALEFDDGKIMLGKHYSLKQVTWENIQARFGKDKFAEKLQSADLVGFVNWTMLPYMSDVWAALLSELCPALNGSRRKIFFDLCDPEKRTHDDLVRALNLIVDFEKYFDVLLGLNEKEALSVSAALGLKTSDTSPESLSRLALEINRSLPVNTVVIHPVAYALAAGQGKVSLVPGPFIAQPKITTGAGDHFNSGFCLGKLLGLDNELCVLTGVTTSGYYVRTGLSPGIKDLAGMLRNWPATAK